MGIQIQMQIQCKMGIQMQMQMQSKIGIQIQRIMQNQMGIQMQRKMQNKMEAPAKGKGSRAPPPPRRQLRCLHQALCPDQNSAPLNISNQPSTNDLVQRCAFRLDHAWASL